MDTNCPYCDTEIDINDPFLAEKEAIKYVKQFEEGDKFSFVTGFRHAMKLIKEYDSIDLVNTRTKDGVENILYGIDLDQCDDDKGWWNTGLGAKFGEGKLKELLEYLKINPSK